MFRSTVNLYLHLPHRAAFPSELSGVSNAIPQLGHFAGILMLFLLSGSSAESVGPPGGAQASGSPSAGRLRPTLSAVARSLRSFGRATADRVPSRRRRSRSDGGESNAFKLDVGFGPPVAEADRPRKASKTGFFAVQGALTHLRILLRRLLSRQTNYYAGSISLLCLLPIVDHPKASYRGYRPCQSGNRLV